MSADALPPCVGGAAHGAPADDKWPGRGMTEAEVLALLENDPSLPSEAGHRSPPYYVTAVDAERKHLRQCMIVQMRMLALMAPECFPTAPGGQMHFGRALMEASAQEMAHVLGLPYPVPDRNPQENPLRGLMALLLRIRKTLVHLNGLYAQDLEAKDPTLQVIDVIEELNALQAMTDAIAGIPA